MMNWSSSLRSIPIARYTFVRFGLVGLLGEAVYFLIYGLALHLTSSTSISLATAGGLCIFLNAYNHSRLTFRVRMTWLLLLGYLQIQFIGFALAYFIGLFLEEIGADQWLVALVTYAIWAVLSFMLTRLLYRTEGRQHKGSSHSSENLLS